MADLRAMPMAFARHGCVKYDNQLLNHRSGTMAAPNDFTRCILDRIPSSAQNLVMRATALYDPCDQLWNLAYGAAAADAQAAPAAAPTPDDLCQQAQHALGLTGIGLHADRAHNAVGIAADCSRARMGAQP